MEKLLKDDKKLCNKRNYNFEHLDITKKNFILNLIFNTELR